MRRAALLLFALAAASCGSENRSEAGRAAPAATTGLPAGSPSSSAAAGPTTAPTNAASPTVAPPTSPGAATSAPGPTTSAAGERTAWRDVTAEVALDGAWSGAAQQVAEQLATRIREHDFEAGSDVKVSVTRVSGDNPAQVELAARGIPDDSVAGFDLVLTLEREAGGAWRVTKAEQADLCARGVDRSGRCR